MRRNDGGLADLQRAFQDFVLQDGDGFRASVRDTRKADRTTLLGVYREGYALRLIEVLSTDYPGLLAMVGSAEFDRLARAYIAAHPSRHPSVRGYGRWLADFLATTPPFSDRPSVAEMARFEWAMSEAFDAPDATPLAADTVMALPPESWETLTFTTLPSLRRVGLAHEVPQAWQRRDDVEPGTLEVGQAPATVDWVIWRPRLDVSYRSLEPDEAVLLDALLAGLAFPDLCATLEPLVGEEQAPARAAGLLRGWVEGGLLGECRV